jgi:hypothetical protein
MLGLDPNRKGEMTLAQVNKQNIRAIFHGFRVGSTSATCDNDFEDGTARAHV